MTKASCRTIQSWDALDKSVCVCVCVYMCVQKGNVKGYTLDCYLRERLNSEREE